MVKVVLYYPSRVVGGAEYLLKTTAELLSEEYEVTIVDIPGGWLSSNATCSEIIIINKGEKIFFDDKYILITPANCIRNLDEVFHGDFKILAWVMHIYNMIPVFPKIGRYQFISFFRSALKLTLLKSEYVFFTGLANYLYRHKALYVMDDSSADEIRKIYDLNVNGFIPVALSSTKFDDHTERIVSSNDAIRCCWLGRLDNEFKTPILNFLIKDLSEASKILNKKIELNIIGDGPGLLTAKKISKKYNNIQVNFLLTLQGNRLKDELKKCDIGFAMGTSALEFGALRVPTILLDASYNKIFKFYTYKWLFEANNYNLGYMIESYPENKFMHGKRMQEVISCLDNFSSDISSKCYEHVVSYHSPDKLKENLINAILKVNTSFEDMYSIGLFKKPYWYFIKKYYSGLQRK